MQRARDLVAPGLEVLELLVGEEDEFATPELYSPPEAVAVTFVIVGEEESWL